MLAKATVRLDPDGTADHRLKLKKGTAPGRYVLKATWKPPHSETTITRLRNIRLVKSPTVRRRASASSRPGVTVATGPRALPDGAFHGTRPARTFKVR